MTAILLVEDNEMNYDMLSRRLQRRGYKVLIATDGQAGLAMAQTELPDLILMDMSLPVLDGWEATRQLKAAGHDATNLQGGMTLAPALRSGASAGAVRRACATSRACETMDSAQGGCPEVSIFNRSG